MLAQGHIQQEIDAFRCQVSRSGAISAKRLSDFGAVFPSVMNLRRKRNGTRRAGFEIVSITQATLVT